MGRRGLGDQTCGASGVHDERAPWRELEALRALGLRPSRHHQARGESIGLDQGDVRLRARQERPPAPGESHAFWQLPRAPDLGEGEGRPSQVAQGPSLGGPGLDGPGARQGGRGHSRRRGSRPLRLLRSRGCPEHDLAALALAKGLDVPGVQHLALTWREDGQAQPLHGGHDERGPALGVRERDSLEAPEGGVDPLRGRASPSRVNEVAITRAPGITVPWRSRTRTRTVTGAAAGAAEWTAAPGAASGARWVARVRRRSGASIEAAGAPAAPTVGARSGRAASMSRGSSERAAASGPGPVIAVAGAVSRSSAATQGPSGPTSRTPAARSWSFSRAAITESLRHRQLPSHGQPSDEGRCDQGQRER